VKTGVRLLAQEHRGLTVFFAAYYVLLIAYGVATGAGQTVFYVIFLLGAALVVATLYAHARLSTVVLWGLALWGLSHMIGGIIELGGVTLYERPLGAEELRFDKVVHFFGFGFATLAAYELLRHGQGDAAPTKAVAITAAFVGLGVGAVNETIEFLITLLPGESNVGGFSNTGWDLVANAAGAAVASVISLARASTREAAQEQGR
jgi:uncharacterized membrane protein YjdF